MKICLAKEHLTSFIYLYTYLVSVDNDLALLLVASRDEQHVVERWRVVQDRVVVEGRQHVPGAELEQVDTALIHGEPQRLGPVRGKGLLEKKY